MPKIGPDPETPLPPIRVTIPVHKQLTAIQSEMWGRLGRKPTYCEVIESILADREKAAAL